VIAPSAVPEDVGRLADAATADHGARWRLRNLAPDHDAAARWADAWLAGRSRPESARLPVTLVAPAAAPRFGPSRRLALMRLRLRDPAGFARCARDPDVASEHVPGATIADTLYVGGDMAGAARAYRAEIAAAPERHDAWAGLLLTRRGRVPRSDPLVARPEQVRALYRAIITRGGAVDPEAVADWLAAG
jgi:hypothetical protein